MPQLTERRLGEGCTATGASPLLTTLSLSWRETFRAAQPVPCCLFPQRRFSQFPAWMWIFSRPLLTPPGWRETEGPSPRSPPPSKSSLPCPLAAPEAAREERVKRGGAETERWGPSLPSKLSLSRTMLLIRLSRYPIHHPGPITDGDRLCRLSSCNTPIRHFHLW